MSTALDMSLDDIIKKNKQTRSGPSTRFPGAGPTRRFHNRVPTRTTPYTTTTTTSKAPESAWNTAKYAAQKRAYLMQSESVSSIESETKLYISNLDYDVSTEDLKELFSEVGDLKQNVIHYDKSGRSKGTAEVVFSRQSDAVAAVKRYNNVQLDGKPMQIEIVGTNILTPAAPNMTANGSFGNTNRIQRSGRSGTIGRIDRGGGGGRGNGRGRGQGRGRDEKITPEDLDADLEKYRSEAMQTN